MKNKDLKMEITKIWFEKDGEHSREDHHKLGTAFFNAGCKKNGSQFTNPQTANRKS
jgi:hypothetical protein